MIDRTLLRQQVRSEILKRVLDGRLKPGERINESRLSAELGVSRTPLREALMGLEQDHVLESDAGRGFSVYPLTAEEIAEIFPIGAELETLALRMSGPLSNEQELELERINREMETAETDGELLSTLDEQWHEVLLRDCGNNRLLEMIRSLRNQIRRYDYAYMGRQSQAEISVEHHRRIMKHLREDKMDKAIAVLRENWLSAVEPMLNWLTRRKA